MLLSLQANELARAVNQMPTLDMLYGSSFDAVDVRVAPMCNTCDFRMEVPSAIGKQVRLALWAVSSQCVDVFALVIRWVQHHADCVSVDVFALRTRYTSELSHVCVLQAIVAKTLSSSTYTDDLSEQSELVRVGTAAGSSWLIIFMQQALKQMWLLFCFRQIWLQLHGLPGFLRLQSVVSVVALLPNGRAVDAGCAAGPCTQGQLQQDSLQEQEEAPGQGSP